MDGPVSITSVYKEMGYYEKADDNPNGTDTSSSSSSERTFSQYRLVIPNDDEVNNVLGGGLMPGSLTLLGGDPGVGKSTLLMQLAGEVASLATPPRGIGMGKDENAEANGHGPVWYVSGEENAIQIASRAHRLGIEESELLLLCETDADRIAELVVTYAHDAMATMDNNNFSNNENNDGEPPLGRRKQPSMLIIDSIQTMVCDNGASSSAGSIRQVRECVHLFLRLAKSTHVPIVLVGHVTKSGDVAGPRTVEHMVDAVLYLEGSGSGSGGSANHWNLRMLRAVKNRFGSASEVGMYEMSSRVGGRLVPVSDPSSFFLSHRGGEGDVEGCAISLVLEGIRPMTVEVQALVSSASGPSFVGRRNVNGISNARLVLILAVLQKRCRVGFWGKMDVYVNVVGGVRLMGNSGRGRGGDEGSESDLAIAVAVVSSFLGIEVRADTAFVGEIGLLGKSRKPFPS
jgi:DNA repair protein RadA/Sms